MTSMYVNICCIEGDAKTYDVLQALKREYKKNLNNSYVRTLPRGLAPSIKFVF